MEARMFPFRADFAHLFSRMDARPAGRSRYTLRFTALSDEGQRRALIPLKNPTLADIADFRGIRTACPTPKSSIAGILDDYFWKKFSRADRAQKRGFISGIRVHARAHAHTQYM
jgi:hypothetical protein